MQNEEQSQQELKKQELQKQDLQIIQVAIENLKIPFKQSFKVAQTYNKVKKLINKDSKDESRTN